MKKDCLQTGTIQAFLDSELGQQESLRVGNHIAACDACALAVAAAEEETALVFSALESEYNSLVPTQRLWSKINTAIETERSAATVWTRLSALISTAFASPSFAGAAGLMIIFGIVGGIWFSSTQSSVGPASPSGPSIVAVGQRISASQPTTAAPDVKEADPASSEVKEPQRDAPSQRGYQIVRAAYTAPRADIKPNSTAARPLQIPGEESYLKTIGSLESSVEMQKDSVLRPGERIAYERDMAVVDDAIRKVRKAVARDPRNQSAREVLYTSYQSKIDLLNSISQKQELVASMQ